LPSRSSASRSGALFSRSAAGGETFIAGYRVYVKAWSEPAQGKYFTSPSDADDGLAWMVEHGYLRPSRFCVQPERGPAVGLIGYNAAYLKSLATAPVPGHFVDWDFEVTFDVEPDCWRKKCPAHLLDEPCPACSALIAAGL
jgi:hypothetical protein